MQPPARIGPYEIQRHLATGGMAETYVALRRSPTEARRVCLKRIRSDKIGCREFVDQFEREARIAAGLRHANIVKVVDFGVLEGEPFLALEFVEGADFGRLIRDPLTAGAIDPALVTHVAVETAIALEFAHRSGVLHRDVSPCNLLISADGELKLGDFGIAKALGRNDPETLKGKFKGKVAYVAPEYVRTSRAGPTGDLYALGITLYEALCGCRPYDDLTVLATFERAARGAHVPLLDRNPALPPRLCEIVEALIRPDPAQRPPSAAALLAQLNTLPRAGRGELAALVQRLRRYEPDPIEEAPTVQRPAAPRLLRASGGGRRLRRVGRWLAAGVLALGVAVVALRAGGEGDGVAGEGGGGERGAAAGTGTGTGKGMGMGMATTTTTTGRRKTGEGAVQEAEGWVDAKAARATLRIAVIPYGQVWVDRVHAGRSPLSVQVAPGEHVITVVSPRGRYSRIVRAQPGATERVIFH